ncbi:putative mitochondrial protein [Tanacetum coccineum]
MTGVPSYQTIRGKGHVKKQMLHLLVDCGSTHNFLDLNAAKRLGCKMSRTCPLQVSVANGQVMSSIYECKNFKWTIQGSVFETDVMILPLGGCEMMLGIQWLATLGTIQFDFKNLVMDFMYKGKRSHDHTIPLSPNTPPINIRPYKHPPNQKDVIELMVKELLEARIIRNSQSSFSSPIVMVKKKDETWRMCVDYRTHEGHYEFLVMPFGLTNAPSTLQALMNTVFKPYLRKFVLVFFDDILVYNKTKQVEYLGHVLNAKEVSTDPTKIQAMENWPIQQTVKQLRGFLGLTGYYRKFIKNYAWLGKPLTNLLKKDALVWSPEAQKSFMILKQAMIQTPVLALPNFQNTFVIETDSSGIGIGAEFLAVLMALDKWRGYLLDRHFKIKTDHFSLKYLLNQRITTPFRTKWLPKLLGFDYEICYNKGTENIVADALSRVNTASAFPGVNTASALSGVNTASELSKVNTASAFLRVNTASALSGVNTASEFSGVNTGSALNAMILYTITRGILKRKGKIVVGKDEQLRTTIVQHYHADAVGGHSGTTVTAHRVGALFYWKGLHKTVKKYVRECDVCQRSKSNLVAYLGLLQPLPIPERIWSDISMDFIVGLPKSQGKSVIFVVVDRLSKYAHFMALSHPYTASFVAQAFLDSVYKLHGLPNSIVSDRDSVFLSHFWQSLFKILKVELKLSTAYHPQTDGQTEVVNKCLKCYLSKNSSIKVSPYEAIYGQTPPLHNPYVAGENAVESVDRSLQARENAIEMLKFHIKRSQDRMKKYADSKRSEREFDVGMWLSVEPEKILDRRIGKLNNRAVIHVLVKWVNHNEEDATWEIIEDLLKRFPDFSLNP